MPLSREYMYKYLRKYVSKAWYLSFFYIFLHNGNVNDKYER